MAAARYTTDFYDENGNVWGIVIWDTTWGGSDVDLGNLPQPGFELTYEGEGDTLFENPIRGSSCKLHLFIRNSTDATFWKSIVARPDKSLYIAIYKDLQLYWQGPIQAPLINFDHASYPIPLEVTATDGLGVLDGLVFDSNNWGSTLPAYSTTAVITGPQLIADIIAKVFPSGVPIDTVLGNGDIFTVSDIITHTSIAAGDIFANTGFIYKQFELETKEAQDGQQYMYYRQVLEEVLRSLGMIIMQVDGYYRLIQVVQRKYASTTIEYIYKIDATEESHRTYDARVNYPTKGWDAEPVESFAAPIKKIILPAKADNNLIIGGGTGAGLTYEAGDTQFAPLMTVPKLYYDYTSVLSKVYAGGSGRRLNLSIDVDISETDTNNPFKVALTYIKLMIKNGAGAWYALTNYDSATDTYFNSATGANAPRWVAASAPSATGSKLTYVTFNHLNLLHNQIKISTPDLPFDVVDTYLLVGFTDYSSFYLQAYLQTGSSTATSVKSIAANYSGSFSRLAVGYKVIEAGLTDAILSMTAPAKFTFTGPYIPASGTKTILFQNPLTTIQPADTTILVLSNSRLEYIDDGSYFANNGVVYTATSNQEARAVWDLSLFNICDFTGGNANQCVKYYNGAAWVNASAWKILPAYATEATHALLYTLIQWMMRFYRKSLRTFNGSLKSSTFQPHLNLIYLSEEYIWCGGTLEASTGKWHGEWVIVSLSDIADSTVGTPVKNYIKDNIKEVKSPYLVDTVNKVINQLGTLQSNASGISGALAANTSFLQGNIDAVPVVSYNSSGAPTANARVNDLNWTLDTATMKFFDGVAWQTAFALLTTTLPDGQIWIGNGSNVATGRTLSGDVTVSNTGVTTIGAAKVVDSMLATSYIKADGTRPLTANWAAGNFAITANSVIVGQAANAIAGGAASGGDFTIKSTSHATKGKIYLGNSYYDEVNQRLYIGAAASSSLVRDLNVSATLANAGVGSTFTNESTTGSAGLILGQSNTLYSALARYGSAYTSTGNLYSGNTAAAMTNSIVRIINAVGDAGIHLAASGAGGHCLLIPNNTGASTIATTRQDVTGLKVDTLANANVAAASLFVVNGKSFLGANTAATAFLDIAASVTGNSSLRIRSGTAPSSPNDGDIWYDGTNIKIRVGAATKTFTIT